tara:strand:+ start:47 stop:229 length:183 start_codon:yes stop_codon:yes gene_type:complete
MKTGTKCIIIEDIPTVTGMLHKNSIVKIDEFINETKIRVIDSTGKIWWVCSKDIKEKIDG